MTEEERRAALHKRLSIAFKAIKGLPIENLLILKAAINHEISLQPVEPANDRTERLAAYWRELYKVEEHESTRKTA